MKTQLKRAFVAAVASIILSGCTRQFTKWEYKVARAPGLPVQGSGFPAPTEVQEKFLNDMSNQGWILFQEDSGQFYFKRPKR
jgi:hypothetical protein